MEEEAQKTYTFIENAKNWYTRFERPISSVSLIGGFIFDAITLKRVDMFWENVWVIIHLMVVAVCIFLIHRFEYEKEAITNPARLHFWLVNILQFFFGGLLSTYIVFYFRSATLFVTWPFLLILGLAFLANERFKSHFDRLAFQVSMLYLSLISFSIFLVPVVLHRIGPGIFFLSTALSLVVIVGYIALFFRFTNEVFSTYKFTLSVLVGGIFVVVNLLYIGNFIPPIPLSLKDAGVYHSIVRNVTRDYEVTAEKYSWFDFFRMYEHIHVMNGSSVFLYSAIFSPSDLNLTIIHEWQRYDESLGSWVTQSRIPLALIGGREEGYRTFSEKQFISPGKWRVNVKTVYGQTIGRVYVRTIQSELLPDLVFQIK